VQQLSRTVRTAQWFSALVARLPYPSATVQRVIAVAAVVAQAGIGVTGSIVRVTGSGLGCPTWPQCFPGSMFPVQHPEYAELNQWIEFGNRLLTVAVVLVAAVAVLAAWRIVIDHPDRRRLLLLAWTMPAGVLLQAVVGGLTVLARLEWWTVAIHFLASTPLIWLATMLLHAFGEGDREPRWLIPDAGRKLLVALVVALGAILVAGTTVTGAGPHGGDPETHRLDAPIEVLAKVHGGLLVCLLAVLAVLGTQILRSGVPPRLRRRYVAVWVVALAQGGLGTLQYALGIPEALVSLHVLGSALVIVATAALWCAARDRGPVTSSQPADGGQLAAVG
jgi:cytochrome c oxidase assembly protein subunit 15